MTNEPTTPTRKADDMTPDTAFLYGPDARRSGEQQGAWDAVMYQSTHTLYAATKDRADDWAAGYSEGWHRAMAKSHYALAPRQNGRRTR